LGYEVYQIRKQKLAFWAPPSKYGNMKTNNKTVHDLSRETLESYLNKNKPETSVWDIEGYQKERNNIIMLFSDAKECTF
jgi:hypothetical protein